MAGISSFRSERHDEKVTAWVWAAILAAAAALSGLVQMVLGSAPTTVGSLFLMAILAGFAFYAFQRVRHRQRKYVLIIRTAGGDLEVLESAHEVNITNVTAALSAAVARRG